METEQTYLASQYETVPPLGKCYVCGRWLENGDVVYAVAREAHAQCIDWKPGISITRVHTETMILGSEEEINSREE